eukprot:g30305.t1
MLLKTLLTEGVSFAAGSSKFREGVDVAFTPEWSKVITQLSQAQPPQDPEQEEQWRQDAMCLARLVSKLHIEVDSAGVAPADVPASELPAPKVGQGSKTLPPQKSPPSHLVGASATSLTYVSTRAALVMDDMRQSGARSDWEASRLPKIIKDPTREDERNVVIFTILFCFLPLPFLVDGFDLSLADSNRLLFNKAVQQFLDDASVAISASAAAQAAVAFLLGEKDFTDAEPRRVVAKKNGGTACQAILNAKLVEVESNAATNEARIVKYGPKSTRNRNAIDASLIEFGRLQKEVFSPDSEIKKEILALRPGELKEFRIRSKEGRREVHLLAAELNMKPTRLAAATAQASPSILGPDASQVILPLVTGGIGLLTVWQERVGREQVAYAKKDAALLLRQHAEAESLVGLAALSAAALPTYVAVSAVASGFSCVGFLAEFGTMAWTFELPTIAVSMMAYILSLERQEMGVMRRVRRFLRMFDEAKPEETFYQRPEDQVVRRVQDDLEELRVTVRGNDPNWIRVGSLVGILTGGSILAPFLLSELLTEVIVPLAGTVLTVFVVYAESDSRSCVAQAKTHAAQVNEQMSTMEELVSISSLWKAYLLGMVGVADCNAILGLVLKSPWNILKWHPHLVRLQEVSQLLVATASVILCGSAAGRLLQTSPKSVENGSGALPTSRRQRIFAIMAAALPPLLLLIFPLEAELAEKAVNSTGASALVVALTMMQAERASCKAERTQASCKRAASLCEAFANRAEQQGALLPFNSAVAIAIAGVITFLTELNPIAAAALTILQAMSWLVASRKGVATKFESLASLQVRSRGQSGAGRGDEPLRLLGFFEVAPEPPVERLAAVGAAAAKKAASEAPEPLWRAVAHAHRGGNLKPEQRSKLKNLAFFPVFPSPPSLLDRADRLSAARLVAPRTGASQEESEEVKALIDAKWLVDVHSPDWPLRDVAEDILALVDELRGALTHALASLAQEAKKLKLKPPQALNGRFPARWLPAYAPGPNGVVPVLNDDNTKAAMLTPAQNLQLLGMLDHPKSRFPSAARLEAKDDAAIEALGILRLSDPRVKLQTRITGAAELVAGSVERIDVVLTLLWRSGGQELPADHMKVCLRKCDSIARELTLGHTNEKDPPSRRKRSSCERATSRPRGRPRCDLLVAGDADDYAAEVEELFEARFETLFRSCETRPAKVLRLLRHLESDKDFNKFLARDFAGVLEQQDPVLRHAPTFTDPSPGLGSLRRSLSGEKPRPKGKDQLEQQQRQQRAEQQAFAEALRQEEKARQAEMEEFVQAATAAKAQASSAELGMASAAKAPTPATPVLSLATQHLANAFTAGANSKDEAEEAKPQVMTVPAVPPMVVPAKAGLQPVGPLTDIQEPTPAGPSASASAVPPRMSPASSEVEEPPTKKLKLSEAENNGDREDQPAENGQTDVTSDAKDATDLKVKEDDGHSALSSLQEDSKSELKTASILREIKRMKIEAKEVLYRPISEGFGFKMLQKMGWKEQQMFAFNPAVVSNEGEGLGKEEKGLATPLWVDPREGRSGLFSAQSGESRPPRSAEDEERWRSRGVVMVVGAQDGDGQSNNTPNTHHLTKTPPSLDAVKRFALQELPLAANPLRFVSEGGAVERISSNLRGLGFVSAQSSAASMANGSPAGSSTGNMMHFQRATAPRPSVASVAPALFGLMADERWQNRSGGAAMLGELLAEALDPSAAERFLRLVDERLGPQVASHLSQTYGRPGQQDYVLQPLWQLTQHHVSTPYGQY